MGGIDFILFSGRETLTLKIDYASKGSGIGGLGIGAIIGIAVGALAVIGIVIFLIVRKRN